MIYIITDGGGFGEQVVRLPCTGNDTVLDAIAQVQGLSQVSSKRIGVARPIPADMGTAQILAVEWEDITALGQTSTNHQLLPGDRHLHQGRRADRHGQLPVQGVCPDRTGAGRDAPGDERCENHPKLGWSEWELRQQFPVICRCAESGGETRCCEISSFAARSLPACWG